VLLFLPECLYCYGTPGRKQIRPDNPENYPEEDAKHWYDMEYAGWNVKIKKLFACIIYNYILQNP